MTARRDRNLCLSISFNRKSQMIRNGGKRKFLFLLGTRGDLYSVVVCQKIISYDKNEERKCERNQKKIKFDNV